MVDGVMAPLAIGTLAFYGRFNADLPRHRRALAEQPFEALFVRPHPNAAALEEEAALYRRMREQHRPGSMTVARQFERFAPGRSGPYAVRRVPGFPA
jgi:hypothetical protein